MIASVRSVQDQMRKEYYDIVVSKHSEYLPLSVLKIWNSNFVSRRSIREDNLSSRSFNVDTSSYLKAMYHRMVNTSSRDFLGGMIFLKSEIEKYMKPCDGLMHNIINVSRVSYRNYGVKIPMFMDTTRRSLYVVSCKNGEFSIEVEPNAAYSVDGKILACKVIHSDLVPIAKSSIVLSGAVDTDLFEYWYDLREIKAYNSNTLTKALVPKDTWINNKREVHDIRGMLDRKIEIEGDTISSYKANVNKLVEEAFKDYKSKATFSFS